MYSDVARAGMTFYLVRALYAHLVEGDETQACRLIGKAIYMLENCVWDDSLHRPRYPPGTRTTVTR
jgi:hypothetical protein